MKRIYSWLAPKIVWAKAHVVETALIGAVGLIFLIAVARSL